MNDRLRSSDLALLADETPSTPMHNVTLEIFDPGESGFDYEALVAHIDDRITFVPRYRQHLRWVNGQPKTTPVVASKGKPRNSPNTRTGILF